MCGQPAAGSWPVSECVSGSLTVQANMQGKVGKVMQKQSNVEKANLGVCFVQKVLDARRDSPSLIGSFSSWAQAQHASAGETRGVS